jgi:hypothetical protein
MQTTATTMSQGIRHPHQDDRPNEGSAAHFATEFTTEGKDLVAGTSAQTQ